MSWKSQKITMEKGIAENLHVPDTWWCSEDDEILIQVISNDNVQIEKVYPVNFKYWTGPKTNYVDGSKIDEFFLKWNFKSK